MSKLEEMIKELCPDGVEYVEIGSVTDYEQPTNYIVQSTKYDDTYKTPVLTLWTNIYSWVYKRDYWYIYCIKRITCYNFR